MYLIGIHRDESHGMLGLSQNTYTGRVLKKFNMNGGSLGHAPIVKGDKLSKSYRPKNDLERGNETNFLCICNWKPNVVQVYTRLDITFAVSVLERFHSKPR